MKITRQILTNLSSGVAITYKNEKGLLHREDGPAIIYADGMQTWFHEGAPYRVEDGQGRSPRTYRDMFLGKKA